MLLPAGQSYAASDGDKPGRSRLPVARPSQASFESLSPHATDAVLPARFVAICPPSTRRGVRIGRVPEAPLREYSSPLHWDTTLGMRVR
jgi:hypothetical protein